MATENSPKRKGLHLPDVVLLGRTLEEYSRYFLLDLEALRGSCVLDVAGGVSSFTAEANGKGIRAVSVDPIYQMDAAVLHKKALKDLDSVLGAIGGLEVYRWKFYQNPDRLRSFRDRALRLFMGDFQHSPETQSRYVQGMLPSLPFADRSHELVLCSYLLFAYQESLNYEFHKQSILELVRVSRGEVRIYPTVTFEGERSHYIDQLIQDPDCSSLSFQLVPTDFEFLVGSNNYLEIRRRNQLRGD